MLHAIIPVASCFLSKVGIIPASKRRCTMELHTTAVTLSDMLSNPFLLIHGFTWFLTIAEYWDDFSMQWWFLTQKSNLWATIINSELITVNKKNPKKCFYFSCVTYYIWVLSAIHCLLNQYCKHMQLPTINHQICYPN